MISIFAKIQKNFWRFWYNKLSSNPKKTTFWTFMNYGYRDTDAESDHAFWQKWTELDLTDVDPIFYDLARLYYEVCTSTEKENFHDKNVIEIGSGRGGGAAFIARNFNPASVTGVDLAPSAILFCKKRHQAVNNLEFQHGDAENLPFSDNTYDIAINIESSHCYPNFEKFILETYRVLKNDGLFYFADFRTKTALPELNNILKKTGFTIVHTRDITQNVLKSLDHTHASKQSFLKRNFPTLLQKIFRTFAGLKGTYMYEQFTNGNMIYIFYILKK